MQVLEATHEDAEIAYTLQSFEKIKPAFENDHFFLGGIVVKICGKWKPRARVSPQENQSGEFWKFLKRHLTVLIRQLTPFNMGM